MDKPTTLELTLTAEVKKLQNDMTKLTWENMTLIAENRDLKVKHGKN